MCASCGTGVSSRVHPYPIPHAVWYGVQPPALHGISGRKMDEWMHVGLLPFRVGNAIFGFDRPPACKRGWIRKELLPSLCGNLTDHFLSRLFASRARLCYCQCGNLCSPAFGPSQRGLDVEHPQGVITSLILSLVSGSVCKRDCGSAAVSRQPL